MKELLLKELLLKKLSMAKEEMAKRKAYFAATVNNELNADCFEKNAIADLTAMLECKTRIKTLEETIALFEMMEV